MKNNLDHSVVFDNVNKIKIRAKNQEKLDEVKMIY
jgi:hypothetical protein